MTAFRAPKPALAIRVGVTGHLLKKLDPSVLLDLRAGVRDALGAVAKTVQGFAAQRKICEVYERDGNVSPPVHLRLLSPLAEGADRIVAEEALELGYSLEAPLPFEQREYEHDFPDTVADFRKLLDRASAVIELDGARSAENRSYEAVGRFVVRNCDLLVAIWDGKEADGRGGTGDIVRFAASSGVPIWWIDAKAPTMPATFIATLREYRHIDRAIGEAGAARALTRYLTRTIFPPSSPKEAEHSVLAKLAQRIAGSADPLDDYLHREHFPLRLPLWRANKLFMSLVAPTTGHALASDLTPVGPTEVWWDTFYHPADRLSVAYSERIRSSYVLVIGFATLALVAAVAGSLIPSAARWIAILVELVFLSIIAVLVVASHASRWHERWITYRLLAELCREQKMLSAVGRSLPRWQVESIETSDSAHEALRDAWVAWYFSAAQRASVMPSCTLAETLVRAKVVGLHLIAGQSSYHQLREERYHTAGARLQNLGEIFFLLTLVAVAVEFGMLLLGTGPQSAFELIDTLVALLPAAAAAFVSFRAYSEFELLEIQSKRMQRVMKRTAEELETICLTGPVPLKSQELGAILHALAMEMLHDVGGWVQLFGIKALETS